MPVPMMYRDGVLTLVIKGDAVMLAPDHPQIKAVKKALKTATEDELLQLINAPVAQAAKPKVKGVKRVLDTVVEFDGANVTVNGKPVHNAVSKRIVEFAQEGLPFEPLVKFLARLSQNPSYQSQQELFDFLEHKNLPITEDGCFLAYKAVRSDFMDKYSGTIHNGIGKTISIERCNVDDNRSVACSAGLHVGALEYVVGYGNVGVDRIVICKVDPADAVSVPTDSSHQKLRTCRYEVVGEFKGELVKPLYASNQSNFENDEDYEDEDDSWSDFDDEYDEDDVDVEDSDCDEDDDIFGIKPDGTRYYNARDAHGHFVKR